MKNIYNFLLQGIGDKISNRIKKLPFFMIFNQKFISMFNDSRKIQDLALTLAILFYIQTNINNLVNFLNLLKDIKI